MQSNNFEIGNVVSWKVGNILSKGLIRDNVSNEQLEVVCFEICGKPTRKKIIIQKSCIINE